MDSTSTPEISLNRGWASCRNILIIRADNLGDLIMSGPAICAIKETFRARITVLTSQMATGIAKHLSGIDEVITYDLPWIKTNNSIASEGFFDIVNLLKEKAFDAAIIFTVFSQNPLPAAMLAYLANIPHRLAYCRENPYHLLTDWVPDKEPYDFIKHQVDRDLNLVKTIGATTGDVSLKLTVSEAAASNAMLKLKEVGFDELQPWVIFHAGVSEIKRQFPKEAWIDAGKRMGEQGYQILFTGTKNEKELTDVLASEIGVKAFSVAGLFTLEEFIAVIKQSPLVVSVNTGTVHIAAAVGTPIVVLYADTNPQHTPWQVPSKVLRFDVREEMRSKNEVIKFLYKEVYAERSPLPSTEVIVDACFELLAETKPGKADTETLAPVTD